MSGSMWIVSYIVLYIAVLVALAVSLNVARSLGRIAVGGETEDTAHTGPGHGIPVGVDFPNVTMTTVTQEVVNPASWQDALILQIVARSDEDVNTMSMLPEIVAANQLGSTVIGVIGRPEFFSQIAEVVGDAHVVDDSLLTLESVLRTKYRPHATYLEQGRVRAARAFSSPEDLAAFLDVSQGAIPHIH